MTGTGARRKRLSADLPQHWLHDPAWWTLGDRAWRLHTHALMWAIGRTDGYVPQDMLCMLLPGSDADREVAAKDLVAAGHWARVTGGWQIAAWEQSQSTVAEIDRNREQARQRKRRQRQRDSDVPAGVTPDVTRDVTGGVRHGTARDGTGKETSSPAASAAGDAHPAAPGQCSACDQPARLGCRTCWPHAHLEHDSRSGRRSA